MRLMFLANFSVGLRGRYQCVPGHGPNERRRTSWSNSTAESFLREGSIGHHEHGYHHGRLLTPTWGESFKLISQFSIIFFNLHSPGMLWNSSNYSVIGCPSFSAGGPSRSEAEQSVIRDRNCLPGRSEVVRLRFRQATPSWQRSPYDALLHGKLRGPRSTEKTRLRRCVRYLEPGHPPLHFIGWVCFWFCLTSRMNFTKNFERDWWKTEFCRSCNLIDRFCDVFSFVTAEHLSPTAPKTRRRTSCKGLATVNWTSRAETGLTYQTKPR